jgi:hypothetical protein
MEYSRIEVYRIFSAKSGVESSGVGAMSSVPKTRQVLKSGMVKCRGEGGVSGAWTGQRVVN